MKLSTLATLLTCISTSVIAQNVTVPDHCTAGFEAGTDTAIVTLPYTYMQVLSIIGSYKNLTWSGNPDNTVTLNGTNNTPGTARTYDIAGAHVIETILTYSSPPSPGPYVEVHNTALLTIPSVGNLSFYIPFDGTVVSSACAGLASTFNFTAHFCASNATVTASVLHTIHSGDALTVGKFLGGRNFSTCAALMAGSGSNASVTVGAVPAQFTGVGAGIFVPTAMVAIVGVLVALLI